MTLPPLKMGFIDMDLNTTVAAAGAITLFDPASSQSLVVVLNTNKNQANFSGGVNATPTKRPANAPNASLAITSNNAVADGTSQDIATVTVKDQTNSPAGGITVTFTVSAGANLVSNTCVTGFSGTCSVAITSGTPGGYAVNASFVLNLVPYNLGPQGANFVGAPSAGNSTLTITTNNRQADGIALDVASVLVQDASNLPVGGIVVTFTVAAPATIVNAGGQCTTDNSGKCNVSIKSSTAGTYAVNVTAPIAIGPQNVIFAGAPAAAHSTLVMTTNNQQYNGFGQDTAQVTLHDASDVPVSGVLVGLSVAAPATLTSYACTTDLNGQCSVGVRSNTAGSFALNVTSPLALGPVTATLTGPPSAAQSTLVVSIDNQPADNTSLDVVQVTIKDASGVPIAGTFTFFSLGAGASFNGAPFCNTNTSGQCTVSIRSSTPGSYAVGVTSPISIAPVSVTFN
jgi:adhesin/invasin